MILYDKPPTPFSLRKQTQGLADARKTMYYFILCELLSPLDME